MAGRRRCLFRRPRPAHVESGPCEADYGSSGIRSSLVRRILTSSLSLFQTSISSISPAVFLFRNFLPISVPRKRRALYSHSPVCCDNSWTVTLCCEYSSTYLVEHDVGRPPHQVAPRKDCQNAQERLIFMARACLSLGARRSSALPVWNVMCVECHGLGRSHWQIPCEVLRRSSRRPVTHVVGLTRHPACWPPSGQMRPVAITSRFTVTTRLAGWSHHNPPAWWRSKLDEGSQDEACP